MAAALPFIAPVVGGLLGGQSSTKTAEQAPWAPAQDWMKQNIATGQKLQDYYQKNPFNDQQKTSYNNLFSDVNNFRENVAPGLMDFANKAMGSSYERQRGGAPGSGGGYGGAVQPGGMRSGGLLGSAGPFSVAPGQSLSPLGAEQNPYTNGAITAPATAPATDPNDEIKRYLEQLLAQNRGGGNLAGGESFGGQGQGMSGNSYGGGGFGGYGPGGMGGYGEGSGMGVGGDNGGYGTGGGFSGSN